MKDNRIISYEQRKTNAEFLSYCKLHSCSQNFCENSRKIKISWESLRNNGLVV